jgi:hypothetical protein
MKMHSKKSVDDGSIRALIVGIRAVVYYETNMKKYKNKGW